MTMRQSLMMVVALGSACGAGAPPNPVGTGETKTQSVGPEGGSLTAGGVTLTIPAGGVAAAASITVTSSKDPAPAGSRTWSPIYTFEPAGLTFASAASVAIKVTGQAANASVLWSRAGGGYEALPTQVTNGVATAAVTHFSSGFVADTSVGFPGFTAVEGKAGMCGVPCSAAGTCDGVFAGFQCIARGCKNVICATNDDCFSLPGDPSACVLTAESRQCLRPCKDTTDCDANQPKCIAGPTGDRYCSPDEGVCVTDRDCGTGLRPPGVCDAATGLCICKANSHCPLPNVCITQ